MNDMSSPNPVRPKMFWPVATGALLLAALWPAVYWALFASVPTLTLAQAQSALMRGDAVVTDVREKEQYDAAHVPGAYLWPAADVLKIETIQELPSELRGKRLLVVCNVGFSSVKVVRRLCALGADAWNVEGGSRMWLAALDDEREPTKVRFRELSPFEQAVASISGFTIKPIYMLISLALILILRRRRELDLSALRWGLILFLTGEIFCYVNFFAFNDESRLVEYFHGCGMALGAGFGFFALFELLDVRLFHIGSSEYKCVATPLCRTCVKNEADCGLKRLFRLAALAFVIIAFMPLTVPLQFVYWETQIVAVRHIYTHPIAYQLYEFYACPMTAGLLLLAAWFFLRMRTVRSFLWGKVLFAGGLGFMSFGLLRMIIFTAYQDNYLWADLWEETTELLAMTAVAASLWFFREGLRESQLRRESAF